MTEAHDPLTRLPHPEKPARYPDGRFGPGNPGRRPGSRNRLAAEVKAMILRDFVVKRLEIMKRVQGYEILPAYLRLMGQLLRDVESGATEDEAQEAAIEAERDEGGDRDSADAQAMRAARRDLADLEAQAQAEITARATALAGAPYPAPGALRQALRAELARQHAQDPLPAPEGQAW